MGGVVVDMFGNIAGIFTPSLSFSLGVLWRMHVMYINVGDEVTNHTSIHPFELHLHLQYETMTCSICEAFP